MYLRGIVQPIREICDAAHQVGAFVHVDACQAAGKIPINVDDLGADLLSIAGHKFSGPPGTGALFVRRGLEIQPLIVGAMQQGGKRAGTEAVLNCAAMGVACLEAQKWLSQINAQSPWLDHLTDHVFDKTTAVHNFAWAFKPSYWHWLQAGWVKP
jgi:cysteine desulfurase